VRHADVELEGVGLRCLERARVVLLDYVLIVGGIHAIVGSGLVKSESFESAFIFKVQVSDPGT